MDIKDCRNEIDRIDGELQQLFEQRMRMAAEISRLKSQKAISTVNAEREREILLRVDGRSAPDLRLYSRVLFTTLFDLSRSYQNRLRHPAGAVSDVIAKARRRAGLPDRGQIACQGVEGAYSQQACDKLFALPGITYFRSFAGVAQAVEQGLCQYGVLPIENSSHGTVNAVYDLVRDHRFFIVRSLKLHVRHSLLANPGAKLEDIREIISHEQAIGQCSRFLKEHPQIKVTATENTALAAKMVAESGRHDLAAISSARCAELYNLGVVDDHVQNSDNNYTRFICISKELEIYPGANRISLMMSLPHRPGALYSIIAKFAALGLNLTKLESRPVPGSDFEFLFYFDLESSVDKPETLSVLNELAAVPSERFVFLGNYSEL